MAAGSILSRMRRPEYQKLAKKAVFTDLNARQSAAGKSKSETKGKQLDLPVHEIGSSRSR